MILAALMAPAFAIPNSEVIDLTPSDNGITYQLYVHAPPSCQEPATPCPVIYSLDAEYSFGLASLITTHLIDRQHIPAMITVSIGYPDKTHYRSDRTRDYTPFFYPSGGYSPEIQKLSGGGTAFRQALSRDIIPYIESHYAASPHDRTLVGHSFGGLFAVSTLLEQPDLFDNYLIVSPSLWYGDGRFKAEIAAYEPPKRAKPLRVYLTVGELEEQPAPAHTMVSDARDLAAEMATWGEASVKVQLEVVPRETHASIFPGAFSSGIRALFQ